MILTVQQKIDAYTFVVNELERLFNEGKTFRGVCGRLELWCFRNNIGGIDNDSAIARMFPEFFILRPADEEMYWWPLNEEGVCQRVAVLKKIIENLTKT